MPAKTADATTALTDVIISSVKQSQELAYSGITAWVDLTSKAFTAPSADMFPFVDAIPNPKDVIEASFGLVSELLATQKEFAMKLVDVVPTKAA